MQNINSWSSSISLLPKLLRFRHKLKNYKDSWFSYLKRCRYYSNGEGKGIYAYPDIFKKIKVSSSCLNNEVIEMLCKIFEIEEGDQKSRKVFLKQKHLDTCSKTQLENTARYLRELNITRDHIVFAPWILLLKKDDIESKRSLIEQPYLFENIRDGLGFVTFDPKIIERYSKQFEKEDERFSPFRNRIYYIGGKLNIPTDFLTLKIVQKLLILSYEKGTLDLYIDLFLEYKCRPMTIVNNLIVFLNPYDTAKKRLNEVSQLKGSLPHSFWWCYTSEKKYKSFYKRAKKYENCDEDDHLEVVKQELQLNEEEALNFLSRAHLKISFAKTLKFKIKKYKEEGLTREDFIKSPDVFNYSENRIKKRIEMLKEIGLFKYATFRILSYEDNHFNECVKALQLLKENDERSLS